MRICHSCQRISLRDAGKAPLWDSIFRGECWDLVHAYNTSWAGWLVLVARRHIEAMSDMTEAEALELGTLLRQGSLALKLQTCCQKTYVMQFAESALHPHVHFHLVPRLHDQLPEDIGYKIFRHLGVPLEQRRSEEEMDEFARAMRDHLLQLRS